MVEVVASSLSEDMNKLLLSSSNISSILEPDIRNSRGFTAMDLLDNTRIDNPNDVRLKEILQFAGALGTETPHNTLINNPKPSTGVSKDWIKYFQFQMDRDSPSDTRNALLVVAALIATVTFQAGMNPPSSFTLDTPAADSTSTTSSASSPVSIPEATRGAYSAAASGLLAVSGSSGSLVTSNSFVFGNTLSFTASLSIIIYLTSRFPFQRELKIAIFSMMFTFGCAAHQIKPAGASKREQNNSEVPERRINSSSPV
ncbi:hypothetical protein Patl1_00073 [Pistacia atlantica]|uniref:Uncharacterized protein n=1 Tax=Pistacia atlantica TaxID=434234 RepID=A0ACC1CDD3_9ROSI|nr:hypothetical protein Patl1_00073 [Pistacia atlantica]